MKTYQKVTGSLMASGYDKLGTQEAVNDMYVVSNGGGSMKTNWDGSQTAPTLTARNAQGQQRMPDKENFNCVIGENDMETVVRRLTPTECERLQNFPDGWTDIGEWVDSKGKIRQTTDSARYRALGNSVALPFWRWLARRIVSQYEGAVTMGSLFSGIGGFEKVFEECGTKAVWASEIDDFCVAVTKKHFGSSEGGDSE